MKTKKLFQLAVAKYKQKPVKSSIVFPEKKYLIVVGGPTASGKTALSIRLAQHFQTEILSADSRQFYREMSIGTAKASPEELAQVPHHFINSLSIADEYSVGDFERDALHCLERLFQQHSVVILAGGSSLYIKALCEGLDVFPEVPNEVRQAVEDLYQSAGIEALQAELAASDPVYFQQVDRANPHRLIRAISVCRVGGTFSSFRTQEAAPRFFTPVYLWMDVPREELYPRINQRVDQMLANGLEAEARELFAHRHLNALQTVGYQELFDYFAGNISRDEAIELIKRNSRRYAKRQLTWMRRDGFWHLFAPSDWDAILNFVQSKKT